MGDNRANELVQQVKLAEQAWIVTAKWTNSGDTFHGPWQYAQQAEAWAKAHLDGDHAVTAWDLAVLTPAAEFQGSHLMHQAHGGG